MFERHVDFVVTPNILPPRILQALRVLQGDNVFLARLASFLARPLRPVHLHRLIIFVSGCHSVAVRVHAVHLLLLVLAGKVRRAPIPLVSLRLARALDARPLAVDPPGVRGAAAVRSLLALARATRGGAENFSLGAFLAPGGAGFVVVGVILVSFVFGVARGVVAKLYARAHEGPAMHNRHLPGVVLPAACGTHPFELLVLGQQPLRSPDA
mmetsp:Transcript_16687/g.31561  ORF Transcript_16687/g.31561 Transcript_16687/m.31561 type:complete len:211 (+) Transcript_16687:1080-1712(+)